MSTNSRQEPLRVYCAGPLFNGSERDEMTAIADGLNAVGFEVYLPHRDGMEFRRVLEVLVDRGFAADDAGLFLHQAIFALDVYQLAVECDVMVWNMNGRTPDEGAVSEAAMAWTLGKPILAYCDDARSLISGRINPLLMGLVDFQSIDRLDAIPAAMQQVIDDHSSPVTALIDMPTHLQRAVGQGQLLWESLQLADATLDDERIATVVAELFAPDDEKENGQVLSESRSRTS